MRFAASLHIPEGIAVGGDTGNRITDFGFVYTQAQYIDSDRNKLVISSDKKIPVMSVVKNNAGKGAFDGSNWTGVSLHDDEHDGQTLTFNLVVNVKAGNWKKDYIARAFIKYVYNGFDYVVYEGDPGDYQRNVADVAQAVYDSSTETPKAKQYCETKILNNLGYIPE